ncbi:MAG: hypothetical protein KDD62_06755, partial [Bdellovibrionales bacterium]|nr:hypothetical protein [Bdellovibrionales bacterium]
MEFDDLFSEIQEVFEESNESNPLETIGLTPDTFKSLLPETKLAHEVTLSISRQLLRYLHVDTRLDATGDELEDLKAQFSEVSEARTAIEKPDAFDRARRDYIADSNQFDATLAPALEHAERLRTIAELDYQGTVRMIEEMNRPTSCFFLRNIEIEFITDVHHLAHAKERNEKDANLAAMKAAEPEVKEALRKLNHEQIQFVLQEELLEEALADLRRTIGLERYIEANPHLKKRSISQREAIDVRKYEQYFQDITEKDLDMNALYRQAVKICKENRSLFDQLPEEQYEAIVAKYRGEQDEYFEQESKTVSRYAHAIRTSETGELLLRQPGSQVWQPLPHTQLLGFIVLDGSSADLEERILQPCGYSISGDLDYDPSL